MKIAVLGTGMVGRALSAKLTSLGHVVYMGTRDANATLGKESGDAYGNPPFKEWFKDQTGIELKTFAEAAAASEMIINCTSGMASLAALNETQAENLTNKTLIDVANPLDFSNGMPPSLNPVNTDSLGEQIQQAFPGTKVVKTLNTMNAYLMIEPTRLQGDHNVFVSGNDQYAKDEVKKLLESFSWKKEQIIDLGDITTCRGTEMLLPIWLRLWNVYGNANFNFHIQKT